MLYIDLATFFLRIDRNVLTVAEMLHGVPRRKRGALANLYGSDIRQCSGRRCPCVMSSGPVQITRYDSAAGLGKPFKNWMGALMGCVLSPDRAKLLLNTILVAISVTSHLQRGASLGIRRGRTQPGGYANDVRRRLARRLLFPGKATTSVGNVALLGSSNRIKVGGQRQAEDGSHRGAAQ